MVQINFNAQDYDPNTGAGDVFESGEYAFQIVSSATKATKAGTGTMLVFELACVEPEQKGKRFTIRLNVANPNAQAVEIAMKDLSAICHVTGQLHITDTQQLHGKPFRIRLEKAPRADDPTKDGNEVRAYLDMNGNPPAAGGATGGAPAAPTAPAAPVAPAAPAPVAPTAAPAAPAPAASQDPNPTAPAPAVAPPAEAPAAPAAAAANTAPPAAPPAPAAPASGGLAPWQTGG